jgi:hypothetical protein
MIFDKFVGCIGSVAFVFVCFGCFIFFKTHFLADTGETLFRKTVNAFIAIAAFVFLGGAWLIVISLGLFAFSALFWNPAITMFLALPVWVAGFYLSEKF